MGFEVPCYGFEKQTRSLKYQGEICQAVDSIYPVAGLKYPEFAGTR
jgi:hypothetical protein